MSDAASFDAIMQCNLLEVFCEALNAAIFVTDKLDELSFASTRLLHLFPIRESAIVAGTRARDLYGALYDAGCRFGATGRFKDKRREDWIAERVASAWKERVDAIEQSCGDRWYRVVSRRFSSGLGFTIIQDVTDHKKKEILWRTEHERVRMTEEILDSLPVAIAVKDRNLNFAAVNQQFCKMLKTTPDAVLGRSAWDLFDSPLLGSLEESDWRLLTTGEDREAILNVGLPAGTIRFLHRARRVGKAGNHYLSMSFDELTQLDSSPTSDLWLKANAGGSSLAGRGGGEARQDGPAAPEDRHRVVYVCTGDAGSELVPMAASLGIELCIVRSRTEFDAFLPALAAAGIALDLVVTEPNADFAFATLSAQHGIRHRMLSPEADVIESIVDAFDRPSRSQVEPAAPPPEATADLTLSDIDVLAIEDNPVNRLVIEQILESLGLNFLVLTSGQDALGRIAEIKPQMVLVDMTLPDMEFTDFMQALEPIMRDNAIKSAVIGMTARDDAEQRLICKQAGLADAMVKPLSPEVVDRMLRKHLFHEPYFGASSSKSAA